MAVELRLALKSLRLIAFERQVPVFTRSRPVWWSDYYPWPSVG
jgi:hypothetical protein